MNKQELIEHLRKQTQHVKEAHLYEKVFGILQQLGRENLDINTDMGKLHLGIIWHKTGFDRFHPNSAVCVELDGKCVLEIMGSRCTPPFLSEDTKSARSFNIYFANRGTNGEIFDLQLTAYIPGVWESFLHSKELETFVSEFFKKNCGGGDHGSAWRTKPLSEEEQKILRRFQ
jgi:hypothetical protein